MLSQNSNIILDIQNLSCGYGGKPVIENFNLKVSRGESIAITGPNGCGKSTLLKAIYHLCMITSGNIFYKGTLLNNKSSEQVKKLGIAYFMQKNTVFSKLSVKENLILSMNGADKIEKKVKIEEMISLFPDLGKWLNKTAGLLSGGQRQQLGFAMLLSQDADLWLLDEPTSGLDTYKSELFLTTLQDDRWKNKGNLMTIIFVEHKTEILSKLAKRIITINN
jgi:branched-chain amino acid transport system ATP-binding protein